MNNKASGGTNLHHARDRVSLRENVGEIFGAEDVTQRSCRQKPCGAIRVFDVGDCNHRIVDSIVDHGVNCHSNGVLGENLQ